LAAENAAKIIQKADELGRVGGWDTVDYPVAVAYLALRERPQTIIDWADFALANPDELDRGGVKNLSGPVFDEARAALTQHKQEGGE